MKLMRAKWMGARWRGPLIRRSGSNCGIVQAGARGIVVFGC
jgi:hypothetical protein